MTKRPDRDEIIQKRERAEEFGALSNARYEEQRVKFLLDRIGAAKRKGQLLKECARRTGERRLTLDMFQELVPNFPLVLGFSREVGAGLHTDQKATVPALFCRFQAAPFVVAYEELYEEVSPRADGRAVGLVFPRKGIAHGLIIHDGVGLDDYFVRGLAMVYTTGSPLAPIRLLVQPFAPLVEAIYNAGHGPWHPEFSY